MKILAIDTVFNRCSVAITDNEKIIYHLDKEGKREQTKQILPMIDDALKASQIKLSEIDALVCNQGPGAFSGIRINTAVVQALAFGCDIPCVGISSLQLLAQASYEYILNNDNELKSSIDADTIFYAVIDARMKQLYIGEYVLKDGIMHLATEVGEYSSKDNMDNSENLDSYVNENLESTSESLIDYHCSTEKNIHIFALATDEENLLTCHDGQEIYQCVVPNAVTLAKLGRDKFMREGGVAPEHALPVYIRHNAWKTLKEQGKQ